MAKPFDLTRLLPPRYRDKTLDSLIRNLFNRHLTKEDSVPLFGFAGDNTILQPGEVQLQERDLERQINQLTQLFVAEHASEKKLFSWPDLVQKLALLGVDYDTLADWFKSTSYNLVPPIDLDKFSNFNEYYWIGSWTLKAPALPYHELGIPTSDIIAPGFAIANLNRIPDYYVIQRGELELVFGNHNPTNLPNYVGWSPWSFQNLWVHKEDAIEFLSTHGSGAIGFSDLVQATRPIIEYFNTVRLNVYQDALLQPSDSGVYSPQIKTRRNQPPLFDLYTHDGVHLGAASSIFYYQEGTEFPIDTELDRRVAFDSNSDFIFEHSLVNDDGELYFYKLFEDSDFSLKTIWRSGPEISPRYVKYDSSGTLINQDKFSNYKNYFWTGVDQPSQPIYNPNGLPEYYVIERGGLSGWSTFNYWVHVSNLRRSELSSYVQATKPIIEFNVKLETELIQAKSSFAELPKFTHYLFDDNTDTYQSIVSIVESNLNDAYLEGHLFARVEDLQNTSTAIAGSGELVPNTLNIEGNSYLQGLVNGVFLPDKDGITYGYKLGTINLTGTGNGQPGNIVLAPICVPEILVFLYLGSGIFGVSGTVTGSHPNLTIGTPYIVSGVTLTIFSGITAFDIEDIITIEVKSYVYESRNLFVRLDGAYRTLTVPSDILTESQNTLVIDASPSLRDGIWLIPPQLENNVKNETRATIKQGDLYFHFISIIAAQTGFVGSEAGKNNWRLISHNLGLGGKIKQYDGQAALLASMLFQEGVTPLTLIDFARESYEQLFSSIRTFTQDRIPQLLNDVLFIPPTSGDSIDQIVIDDFKTYFANSSSVVIATETLIDDALATNFFDSTSSLRNLVMTLPYMGLAARVQPKKLVDLELNIPVLVHHDGHYTTQPVITADILKKIVTKKFLRGPGQETPGIISGFHFPIKPYSGQFWFKTSTNELFYFSAISDTGEQPTISDIGAYTFDRITNQVFEFNGTWNLIGSDVISAALPWVKVDLGLIEQNLTLAIETLLYENCPTLVSRLDTTTLETQPRFEVSMQQEFERFGVRYGTTDVYSSSYIADNEFTWNYSSLVAIGAPGTNAYASWQELYRGVYGTARPDLQPWIPAGYASESAMLADLGIIGLIGVQTSWNIIYWNATAIFLSAKYVLNGRTARLSINTTTGGLIAPYAHGDAQSLVLTVPISASNQWAFNDLGPVELFWTRTLDYLYSKQKSYFKLDPLTYVRETWGVSESIIGEYRLNPYFSRKNEPSIFQLHGDSLKSLAQLSWLTTIVTTIPAFNLSYNIACVSRIDGGIFKLTGTGLTTPVFFTGNYIGTYVTVTINPSIRQLFWGDSFTINVDDLGNVTSSITTSTTFKAEGFNQIYVQYGRFYGQDLSIAINTTLFRGWDVKLGYRFGGLVNTDSITLKSDDDVIDESAFKVYLKENKFLNSSWLNALRVQLVQRGSTVRSNGYMIPATGPGGTPGEDWIFRIDNYNEARTKLSWFSFDPDGDTQTFIALDGQRTSFSWVRKKTIQAIEGGTNNVSSPFLIVGIQNFIDFIFGYADKLDADGWRFSDEDDPILDADTGRPLGYQLLIEKFLVQQFSTVEAGSTFVFNPFANKVWYKTERGAVANLNELLGIEQETVATILDANRKRIPANQIRVFRQDEVTQLVSDTPIFTLHLLTSEYEHVVLFDNYSVDSVLLYDSFLGQRTSRIFISGQKQANFTGRIDFGGHFLIGDEMKRNIESSVDNILRLYDTTNPPGDKDAAERGQALLGFQKKDYFADRGSSNLTEFRFWQGVIANKGTNFSIDAYVNSAKYKTAKLDEYWAYKLASYGDARLIEQPELKVEANDCTTERSNYLFLEDDQLELLKLIKGNGGYDLPDYDVTPYDVHLALAYVDYFGTEAFDTTGCIIIRPDDEARWFRYLDLRSFQYFIADRITDTIITPTTVGAIYTILDVNGKPARADVYELVENDITIVNTYFENGDLVPGSEPPEYTLPKFVRLNHSTIQITDSSLVGHTLRVRGYAPAFSKYSPSTLYNYVNNSTTRDDLVWWDPARGSQHPQAITSVDYQQATDPARYNISVINEKNPNLVKLKPWGDGQIGKVWWNTKRLAYQNYSDTKLYPDLHERLARWGATADYTSVESYEWVKSSAPPITYTGDGVPAMDRLVKRDRTWWQRTVAWRFSSNPVIADRAFIAYQPSKLQINLVAGRGTIVLKTGDFKTAKLIKGSKVAGAIYGSTAKTDSNLVRVFGQATITSDAYHGVGNAAGFANGPTFVSSLYANGFAIELDQDVLGFRSDILGQYKLDREVDVAGITFIKLTHVSSGNNQRLEFRDTSIKANTQNVHLFDKLGVKLSYNVIFGHIDSWPSFGITTSATRITIISTALSNVSNQIYVRSIVDVFAPIPFLDGITNYTTLDSQSDVTTLGWVAWNDPVTNPLRGQRPPFNTYHPVVGEWVEVGPYLNDLAPEILVRTRDAWSWFDGTNYSPYRSTWSTWTEILPDIREFKFLPLTPLTANQIFLNELTYIGLKKADVETRARVYINGVLQRSTKWFVDDSTGNPTINLISSVQHLADSIVVDLISAQVTDAEMKFDPEITDDDPFKLVHYKRDVPYVLETRRNEMDKQVKSYYFWVKDKATPGRGKVLSVKKISQLLRNHDGTYGVPQVLKYFNQVDGRPNRYGLLSLNNFGHHVKASDTYKLRLTKNPTLRDSDHDLELKNVHVEWQLLRPLQSSPIPLQLWELLTNAMVGGNLVDQTLPFESLSSYDDRNSTAIRYGFDKTQILVDPRIARDTVAYTIRNTRVDKYVNDELIPDYISYTGFNINQLDEYLLTTESIRLFMSELWRFAKPKQINEIFFAVLDDAASKNLELTDFFKTSFIALNDIRTIETPQ